MISRICQQARITFDVANLKDLARNLHVLKSLVDSLRYCDLRLNPELISKKYFNQTDKAPCTFVSLYEDERVTMSVFIMAENYTMPLHDHPQMHGVLKCIAGSLSIQSFSINEMDSSPVDVLERLYAIDPERPGTKKHVQCRREAPLEVNEESPAVILTPDQRNFHEITALGGPVAFFDVLSPPYDTPIEDRPYLRRKCTFFKVQEAVDSPEENTVLLEKTPQPLSYFCDSVEYP